MTHTATVPVASGGGGEFKCYLATPSGGGATPAIVLGSAIHGVDEDLRTIATAFASRGFIAAAPDLFWRTVGGPLERDDPRAALRAQPRLERIEGGERDFSDVRAMLERVPRFNGRAAVMGFCYSGPYAILGPKRLGYDAGVSCHGTQMRDFIGELEGLEAPLHLLWGDRDALAPADLREAFRAASIRMRHLRVHVFPGVGHGYMMRARKDVFNERAYDASMACAFDVLEALR